MRNRRRGGGEEEEENNGGGRGGRGREAGRDLAVVTASHGWYCFSVFRGVISGHGCIYPIPRRLSSTSSTPPSRLVLI